MKLITRDTDYAMRALLYLAAADRAIISTVELLKSVGLPRPFARKIMHQLEKHRIVESVQGAQGGFRLAVPSQHIYLIDLIKIFQGDTDLNECLFKKKICPNIQRCPLRKKISRIETVVAKEFNNVTVASLLKEMKEHS